MYLQEKSDSKSAIISSTLEKDLRKNQTLCKLILMSTNQEEKYRTENDYCKNNIF